MMPHTGWLLLALSAQAPPPLEQTIHKARESLVAAQDGDGSFAPNRHGRAYRSGITGLCALALLDSERTRHREAARKALAWLAAREEDANMYAHAWATLALCRGCTRWPELDAAARRSVETIVRCQNESGGWGYRPEPGSPHEETCLAAALLEALHAAKGAGMAAPEDTILRAGRFLERRYEAGLRMFHADAYPSPSYGATASAAAALRLLGGVAARVSQQASSWLGRQSLEAITADLPGKPFRGYLRGRFHYELAAHARALVRAGKPDSWKGWRRRVHVRLWRRQAADGSFEGWFGKPYGTALVVLTLAPE